MQNKITKSMGERKKYGKPYKDKEFLRHGDIQQIADASGYKYISVVQMLSGDRKMRPAVKAAADRLVNENKELIEKLNPTSDN